MKKKRAKEHYKISCSNQWDFDKFIDKIYADHKKEVKELKQRITDLEWMTDTTRWGA